MNSNDYKVLLAAWLGWLEGRCRRAGGRAWEDLLQQVAVDFLDKAPDWFEEEAKTSREAQAKTLLSYCLLQRCHERWERLARERPVEGSASPELAWPHPQGLAG